MHTSSWVFFATETPLRALRPTVFLKHSHRHPMLTLLTIAYTQVHGFFSQTFSASGVQLVQSTSGLFHLRRVVFFSHLKVKVDDILVKSPVSLITLNIDVVSIPSRSHTHPSHSQTSRFITSSLSVGIPLLCRYSSSPLNPVYERLVVP